MSLAGRGIIIPAMLRLPALGADATTVRLWRPRLAALGGLLVVASQWAAAQTVGSLGVGASYIKYDGFLASGAAVVAPSLRFDSRRVSLAGQGSWAVFESGNVLGQFAFQAGAGFATFGIGKATGNKKLAYAGRDIVRAQLLSQAMVQTLKYTIRRERPDSSDNKSFPSGHSSSMFATATVLHRYYGWKAGVPAYALGGYVALARMAWNRHHITDVVMGAGFGIASARTVTMSMGKSKFTVGVQPQVGGASVNFTKIVK